jgi:hypothetical protein
VKIDLAGLDNRRDYASLRYHRITVNDRPAGIRGSIGTRDGILAIIASDRPGHVFSNRRNPGVSLLNCQNNGCNFYRSFWWRDNGRCFLQFMDAISTQGDGAGSHTR